jgi:hypothetical protein
MMWPWVGLMICGCITHHLYRLGEDLYAWVHQDDDAAVAGGDGA